MVTTRRQEQLQQQQMGEPVAAVAAIKEDSDGVAGDERAAVPASLDSPQQQEQSQGGVAEAEDGDASPSTPPARPVTPEGDAPLQQSAVHQPQQQQQQQTPYLKSALKARRPAGAEERLANGGEDAVTPLEQVGVKKRVRIHSGNNIVHVFRASSADSRLAVAGGGAEADGTDPTPQSRRSRGPITLGSSSLLKYQAFIRGENNRGDGSDGGVDEAGAAASGRQPAGGGSGDGNGKERQQALVLLPWAASTAILCWMLASSALIFVNKEIMVGRGFRFPFALTTLSSAASTLLGWVAGVAGVAPMRGHPSLRDTLTKLFPVAFCSAATLYLGNGAYLGLSVAFINILKALTPAVTLVASMLLGLERPSLLVAASLVLMAAGTALATAQEAATSHFSWMGFIMFLLSILFEALRVVFVERLLGRARYNAIEVLVYIGPLTLLLLLAGALANEREGLLREGVAIAAAHPLLFAGACAVSFAVNAFSFFAIQASSSLTFKVAGCVKNGAVVWLGVSLGGDELTPKEWVGYALSLLGFLAYTLLRTSSSSAAPAAPRLAAAGRSRPKRA